MESIETQVLPARLAESTRGSGEVPVGRREIGLLQRSRALRFVNRGRRASDYRSLTLLQAR